MFQMCSAYSRIARSDENLPMRATFKLAVWDQFGHLPLSCHCGQVAKRVASLGKANGEGRREQFASHRVEKDP